VSVFGGQKYAVRVRLDPRALASRGLPIGDVADAIRAANVNLRPACCRAPTAPPP